LYDFQPVWRNLSGLKYPIPHEGKNLDYFNYRALLVFPREDGIFYPEDFAKTGFESHTKLVSVMYVNNETGQVLPVREIANSG